MPRHTQTKPSAGIGVIAVSGYKSLLEERSVAVRPLTILCGANSSGKSSVMQPLLLLKQTLESSYDAGPLLLNGPNIKFTSAEQFLSRFERSRSAGFSVRVGTESGAYLRLTFKKQKGAMEIDRMDYSADGAEKTIRLEMAHQEIMGVLAEQYRSLYQTLTAPPAGEPGQFEWAIVRNRCFLVPNIIFKATRAPIPFGLDPTPASLIDGYLRDCIYLPGLRGNPERTYPVTAVGKTFPGPFQEYAASVIAQWQREKNYPKLQALRKDLERLGLTSRVRARRIADTQVELRVGRLPRRTVEAGGGFVNIADVGLGVSQALPVLVALHVASPGQLVYLEQPEIHLHPRAQSELAAALAGAVNRDVRVVVETHSSLVLLGIQTLVAKGVLPPEFVKLHWFTRRDDGVTEIQSADLSEDGSFGSWPEDFAEVSLKLENQFLSASEAHRAGTSQKAK